MADEHDRGIRTRARLAALLVGLLVGAAAGFGVGRFTHVFHGHVETDAAIDKLQGRASNALAAGKFDEPPDDNVLDLTDQILAMKADESRARELRQRAADRLVRLGLQEKASGKLAEALRHYELAARFVRADHGLVEEIAATKRDLLKTPK